jgi:hypothetical protein
MLHHVGLVRTDVSEECVTTIFKVDKIHGQRKASAVGHHSENLKSYKFAEV